jgi:hypothetical protein
MVNLINCINCILIYNLNVFDLTINQHFINNFLVLISYIKKQNTKASYWKFLILLLLQLLLLQKLSPKIGLIWIIFGLLVSHILEKTYISLILKTRCVFFYFAKEGYPNFVVFILQRWITLI